MWPHNDLRLANSVPFSRANQPKREDTSGNIHRNIENEPFSSPTVHRISPVPFKDSLCSNCTQITLMLSMFDREVPPWFSMHTCCTCIWLLRSQYCGHRILCTGVRQVKTQCSPTIRLSIHSQHLQ